MYRVKLVLNHSQWRLLCETSQKYLPLLIGWETPILPRWYRDVQNHESQVTLILLLLLLLSLSSGIP